jgi:hypothetical protein
MIHHYHHLQQTGAEEAEMETPHQELTSVEDDLHPEPTVQEEHSDDEPVSEDEIERSVQPDPPLRRSTRESRQPDRLVYTQSHNICSSEEAWLAKARYLEDLMVRFPMCADVILN